MNENIVTTPVEPNDTRRLERNALWLGIVTIILAVLIMVTAVVFKTANVWIALLILAGGLAATWFVKTGRFLTACWVTISLCVCVSLIEVLTRSGSGFMQAVIVAILISGIAMIAMPRRLLGRMLLFSLFISVALILIDIFDPATRLPVATQSPVSIAIIFASLVILSIFIAKGFPSFDLRTKIVLGILVTGGLSLGVLSFFAINTAQKITESISQRLETSVGLLAEEQLINTVFIESDRANKFFDDIAEGVASLSTYERTLQDQKELLGQGSYWDAANKLSPLNGGQYGNPSDDISSVFVPVNVELNDDVLTELNTSAYLDFTTPQLLKENPAILAVYYIHKDGVVRYYPNIELASILPPDFDATSRPYYKLSSPLFNPQKRIRWTIPYVDAAGGGLVVTAASPIYVGDGFSGVIAADIQLARITEQVSGIKVGNTGYAFMIDDAGRIISMPPSGYKLFNMNPEELAAEDYFKQTILGFGETDVRAIITRMVAGGNGLNIINDSGIDKYIAYAPVASTGYSIALVVPVSEMQTAISVAKDETQVQTRTAIRTAVIILVAILLGAIGTSLSLGNLIATPIRRLTEVASRITGGDLTAKVVISTRDEIGALAESFNIMTSRLSETLGSLETNIQERTLELATANEKNERRARQFETIAHITRTISSTRELNSLLSQTADIISREFGFYHVGIFLLDVAKEYAVLSATNSEGGQFMLERGHRLKVGEMGIVGFVTKTGKARVALDTGTDAVFFNNPDLPNTRSEISLPLKVGDEIIGALDVQSTEANAFSQEDINILSTLADQVSIAVQNARQFEETRRALNESEALSRQFIQTGWQNFTQVQKLAGIHHTGAKSSLLYTTKGNGKGEYPLSTGQLKARERGAHLSLPLKLRGEVIGSVDVHSPDNAQWDQDELDIVTAIIERAALAMENARLLAESQKLAAKERTIGNISAKISAQSDIDELLKTAVQELGRTLPGMDITVQFKKEETEW